MATPGSLIQTLVAARGAGDLATAAACYDARAVIVIKPGQVVGGADAIAEFVSASAKLGLVFTGRSIIEGGGVALHQAAWSLSGPDGSIAAGHTADVLRQLPDGTWRLALDNPWGSGLVQGGDG